MDSGRFESVLKASVMLSTSYHAAEIDGRFLQPYSFHQVMRSMFVPLRLATDARGLEFVVDLDKNIDEVRRIDFTQPSRVIDACA